MSYSDLNLVYRNLDIYNFPQYIPLIKQIQSIRGLNTMRRRFSTKIKLYPSEDALKERLMQISRQVFLENNEQTIHELMDAAIELEVQITQQQGLERHYDAVAQQRVLLQQYQKKLPPKDIFALGGISEDKQNVHHTSINDHVKKVVIALCDDFPSQPSVWRIMQSELQKQKSWNPKNDKSLKFIRENSSVFTDNHITLKSLTLSVFLFIMHQQEKEQLFTRFNEELSDMQGTCSTGHLSRLINVVQGFSEKYTIQMDPEKEIKESIFKLLTFRLQRAPEEIQDGMLEKSQAFQDFVLNDQTLKLFKDKFGTAHETYIVKCIREYIGLEI